jgi:hypothetical protein
LVSRSTLLCWGWVVFTGTTGGETEMQKREERKSGGRRGGSEGGEVM